MLLASRIYVTFDGSDLDVTRPAQWTPEELPDLAGIYLEHALKLVDNGFRLLPPGGNTVSWTRQMLGPDGTPSPALAGWDPATRLLGVREDLGHAPMLVSDLVAHELVHQVITDYPGCTSTGEESSQQHAGWFLHFAGQVAEVLDLPAPEPDTIAHWPQTQRPDGFYGPYVRRRKA